MTAVIEARGLKKSYGKTRALDGLDLVAEGGRVLAVLGPNGAGKTTFVRAVATLLRPDGGTLRIAGHDAVRDPGSVRRVIGLAGQFAARAYSGGIRRRLDLGASLVGAPRLLLLDEPTAGLDPRSRLELWDAIRALVERGTDVLLTTQYLDEADHLADDIVIIDHGRAVASGSPEELKRRIGGSVIELHVRDDGLMARAAELLRDLEGGDVKVDAPTRRVSVAIDASSESVMNVLRAVHGAGVEVEDFAMRQPNLDEVFLALTGRPAEDLHPAATAA